MLLAVITVGSFLQGSGFGDPGWWGILGFVMVVFVVLVRKYLFLRKEETLLEDSSRGGK